MPIANCVVATECKLGSDCPVELWAEASGKSKKQMTINLIPSNEQFGHKYKVMASLLLPSIWSESDVSSLQLGLANALAKYFSLALNDIHVVTLIVPSARVVESGKVMKW